MARDNSSSQLDDQSHRTPRTQRLVEQANGTVKFRMNNWKRAHGSSHWSKSLDVSNFFNYKFLYKYPEMSILRDCTADE